MISDGCAANGSMTAVEQSGFSSMSDSLIAFHPAIDEPSNITPSSRNSGVMVRTWWARCCHLPRGSVKRKSTYFASCSVNRSITVSISPAIVRSCCWKKKEVEIAPGSGRVRLNRVGAALAGADADRLLDGRDEDFAVADAPGMRRLLDRLDRALNHRIFHDDFDLHLGQEVDDVFRAAIELGMALLPAEALGLDDGDPFDADLVQGLLHFIQLERLDDRLDLLHRNRPPMPDTRLSPLASA